MPSEIQKEYPELRQDAVASMELLLDGMITPKAKIFYMIIRNLSNIYYYCDKTNEELSKISKFSIRSIQEYLIELDGKYLWSAKYHDTKFGHSNNLRENEIDNRRRIYTNEAKYQEALKDPLFKPFSREKSREERLKWHKEKKEKEKLKKEPEDKKHGDADSRMTEDAKNRTTGHADFRMTEKDKKHGDADSRMTVEKSENSGHADFRTTLIIDIERNINLFYNLLSKSELYKELKELKIDDELIFKNLPDKDQQAEIKKLIQELINEPLIQLNPGIKEFKVVNNKNYSAFTAYPLNYDYWIKAIKEGNQDILNNGKDIKHGTFLLSKVAGQFESYKYELKKLQKKEQDNKEQQAAKLKAEEEKAQREKIIQSPEFQNFLKGIESFIGSNNISKAYNIYIQEVVNNNKSIQNVIESIKNEVLKEKNKREKVFLSHEIYEQIKERVYKIKGGRDLFFDYQCESKLNPEEFASLELIQLIENKEDIISEQVDKIKKYLKSKGVDLVQ